MEDDDDNFGFGDEFDFDTGNFPEDTEDARGPDALITAPAPLHSGDDFDDFFGDNDVLQPQAKRPRVDGAASASASADPEHGTVAPPPINDVQAYLPNVSPTAFPVVVNLIAQADLNVGIDLRALSCATRNVEFMPSFRNASATMRLHDPTAVVMIRSSGSMTVIGAASVGEARQAAELAARIVRKALNLQFDTLRFRVRSLAARFNVCSPVRINELAGFRLDKQAATGLTEVHCSYEPERFNGCVVKLVGEGKENNWIVSCLVYVTGKVTLLGARSADELRFAFDALVPILAQYIGASGP